MRRGGGGNAHRNTLQCAHALRLRGLLGGLFVLGGLSPRKVILHMPAGLIERLLAPLRGPLRLTFDHCRSFARVLPKDATLYHTR